MVERSGALDDFQINFRYLHLTAKKRRRLRGTPSKGRNKFVFMPGEGRIFEFYARKRGIYCRPLFDLGSVKDDKKMRFLVSWRHKCLFLWFFVVLTFHLPFNLFAARGEASGKFFFI